MKKLFKKLRTFFGKKFVEVVLVILGLFAVAIAVYFMFIYEDNDKAQIGYEDYIISNDHYGKIEKYDSSNTVDGYKGDGDEAYYIIGSITAKEDKNFTIITFNLYDKNNKLLGTAVAGLNEVKKNKTYKFKALSLVESRDVAKIDHYKIKSVELG